MENNKLRESYAFELSAGIKCVKCRCCGKHVDKAFELRTIPYTEYSPLSVLSGASFLTLGHKECIERITNHSDVSNKTISLREYRFLFGGFASAYGVPASVRVRAGGVFKVVFIASYSSLPDLVVNVNGFGKIDNTIYALLKSARKMDSYLKELEAINIDKLFNPKPKHPDDCTNSNMPATGTPEYWRIRGEQEAAEAYHGAIIKDGWKQHQ